MSVSSFLSKDIISFMLKYIFICRENGPLSCSRTQPRKSVAWEPSSASKLGGDPRRSKTSVHEIGDQLFAKIRMLPLCCIMHVSHQSSAITLRGVGVFFLGGSVIDFSPPVNASKLGYVNRTLTRVVPMP